MNNTGERYWWNGARGQPSQYASEAEWCDAVMRRLAWRFVCESPLGANLAIAGALTRAHRLGKYVWSEGGWSPNVNGKAAP